MHPPLDGHVLVTGASSGIGEQLARQVAPTARTLVLVARRAARLEALATELAQRHPSLDVRVMPCDLGDVASVDALVAALDVPVDVLINNAGLGDLCLFEEGDPDKLTGMIMVNVVGLSRLTRALLPGMIARGRGGVLNVASTYGLVWTPGAAAYIGTKYFVRAFSESLRSEVRGAGVVVTALCPGPVESEFEDVAGSFFNRKPPRFVFISAEQCAREALAGFARNKAVVIPGWLMKLVIPLTMWAPSGIVRLVQRPFAAALRADLRKRADSGVG